MVSGFRDYRSPVGMADENCRSVLRCKSSLGNCYVVLQRYCRILDDADAVAVALQDLVDALPASAIHKATMDENDVLHGSIPPSFNDAAYIGGTRFLTLSTGPGGLARMWRGGTRGQWTLSHKGPNPTSRAVGEHAAL